MHYFQVGDQILAINGEKVNDRSHFYKLLRFSYPNASLEVLRYDETAQNVPDSIASAIHDTTIPADRDKLIDRHSGYHYMVKNYFH